MCNRSMVLRVKGPTQGGFRRLEMKKKDRKTEEDEHTSKLNLKSSIINWTLY